MGRKKILIPIYNVTITLWVGKCPNHLEDSRLGGFYPIDSVSCEVWVKDRTHLLHEAFHVTVWIMNEKGCTLTNESDEAYAYLLEYVYKNLLQKC